MGRGLESSLILSRITGSHGDSSAKWMELRKPFYDNKNPVGSCIARVISEDDS
jgi:hypothetical protein